MDAAKKATVFTVCTLLLTCIIAACGDVPTAPSEGPPQNCVVINGEIYCY